VSGLIALLMVVIGGGMVALSGHWRSTAGPQRALPASPRVSVVAASARTRDVGVYLYGLGTVTPLNTVTVRTRVDGQLLGVHFQEGQIVRSGDLLAEIDPRPFEAQLTQFEGQLERDQALLASVADQCQAEIFRQRLMVHGGRMSCSCGNAQSARRRAPPAPRKRRADINDEGGGNESTISRGRDQTSESRRASIGGHHS